MNKKKLTITRILKEKYHFIFQDEEYEKNGVFLEDYLTISIDADSLIQAKKVLINLFNKIRESKIKIDINENE